MYADPEDRPPEEDVWLVGWVNFALTCMALWALSISITTHSVL